MTCLREIDAQELTDFRQFMAYMDSLRSELIAAKLRAIAR